MVKSKNSTQKAKQKNNLKDITESYNQLTKWWNENIKYTPTPTVSQVKYNKSSNTKSNGTKENAPKLQAFTENIKNKAEESATNNNYSVDEKRIFENSKSSEVATSQPYFSNNQTIITNSSNIQKNETLKIDSLNRIKISEWDPERSYLKVLKAVEKDKKYETYLELRSSQEQNPSFYFDVANYFYSLGDKSKAFLILSTIADLDLENHQLYKSLLYVLREWEAYPDALYVAKKIVNWRNFEPQSHRDLGLTFEDNKQYQEAFDELIKALNINYYSEVNEQYDKIQDIILIDINRLIATYPEIKTGKLNEKSFKPMPVGLRIILNWNQMDTDIDLHVIEPTKEECYYGNTSTKIGGRFSKDFTQGYGPEQYLLRNTIKGKYDIKTNYFGERKLTESGPATVMVEIYLSDKNGKIQRKLKTIQLSKVKEKQILASLTID